MYLILFFPYISNCMKRKEDQTGNAIRGLLGDRGYEIARGYYGDREVDCIIRNGEHIIMEITSSLRKSDIPRLMASAEDYEAKKGVKPRIMVAAIYIAPTVMREVADCPRHIEIFSPEE